MNVLLLADRLIARPTDEQTPTAIELLELLVSKALDCTNEADAAPYAIRVVRLMHAYGADIKNGVPSTLH